MATRIVSSEGRVTEAEHRSRLKEHLVNFFESDPLTGYMPEGFALEVMNVVDQIVDREHSRPNMSAVRPKVSRSV